MILFLYAIAPGGDFMSDLSSLYIDWWVLLIDGLRKIYLLF